VGFPNLFVVDSVGKSGGLALFWEEDVIIDIQNYSQRHINGIIQNQNYATPWKFTWFYEHPDVNKRQEAWSLLQFLARLTPEPWLCIGNFNEVLTQLEKWGERERPSKQTRDFQVTLEKCELSDIGFIGPKFTWSNSRENQVFIKERLDRGVVNSGWREIFPKAELFVEASTISDHAVLEVCLQGNKHFRRKEKKFRYEASWNLVKDYHDIILRAWNHEDAMTGRWVKVNQKLTNCQRGILEWRNTERGSQQKIYSLKQKLNEVQGSVDTRAGEEAILIQRELNCLLDHQDMKWRQRTKVDWLRFGGRNTKFFHANATQRRKKNQIFKIQDERGTTCETLEASFC
jgi:hypothetical protein